MPFPTSPAEPAPVPAEELVSLSGRPWRLRPAPPDLAFAIAQRHGLPELVGRVLAARGVRPEEVPRHLEPRLRDWLPDPSHLHDVDRAAARLADAVEAREPVGIVGDYDVDGASSAALLGRWLRALGVPFEVAVPDRLEHGYGPHPELLERLAERGIRLVVTVDAGTTAFAALEHARRLGLEVIVVDHHQAEEALPPALAVVNPNRRDQESPLRPLAAVGVTFVLLVAANRELRRRGVFAERIEPDLRAFLDLVALGTVCDVVPLTGLNRAFVAQGLRVAAGSPSAGLRALARLGRIERVSEPWHFGFVLGPRLNAGGRIGTCDLAVRLLLAEDEAEIERIAAELERLNAKRQQLERTILEAALTAVQPQLERELPVLFATGGGWHPGVVGIVAGRLVERFDRPALVGGLDPAEGRIRGSGRSVEGFDIGAAVIAARREGLLEAGGGHELAAGFTLPHARREAFLDFLTERAGADFGGVPQRRPLWLDGALTVAALTRELAAVIGRMAPFGAGNPEPRFVLTDATVFDARIVGRDHIACRLAGTDGRGVGAIAFRAAGTPWGEALRAGRTRLWLAGRVELDRWQGRERVRFRIEDAAPAPDPGAAAPW